MNLDDRHVYAGLLYLREMEAVLEYLVKYVDKQISLESVEVKADLNLHDESIKQKFVVSHISVSGDIEGELFFGTTLNLALAFSCCMLGHAEAVIKKYIETNNFDSDMQDASKEIFNLSTGALEKTLRKCLDFEVKCTLKDVSLIDLSNNELLEGMKGACDWIIQQSSVKEMQLEGFYLQVVPEKLSAGLTAQMERSVDIESARSQFESAVNIKAGQSKKKEQRAKRILLIEDTHLIRRLMAEHLEAVGYLVFEKSDGLSGLRWALMMGDKIDLIILDLRLPSLNGYQVMEVLKKNEKTKNIPVIICSSVSDPKELMKLKKMGMEDFLLKPFVRETLIRKVIQTLKKIGGSGA